MFCKELRHECDEVRNKDTEHKYDELYANERNYASVDISDRNARRRYSLYIEQCICKRRAQE